MYILYYICNIYNMSGRVVSDIQGILRSTTQQGRRRGLQNVKKQCEFKYLKEVSVNWLPYLIFQACFMTSSSAKTIVYTNRVTELKSTLRNSSHLSASSRRPEDVKMLKVALFTEWGRIWEYWDYKLFILFVFH